MVCLHITKDAASGCRQNATRLTICSKLVVKEKDAQLENADEKDRRSRKMVALCVISCDLDGERSDMLSFTGGSFLLVIVEHGKICEVRIRTMFNEFSESSVR